MEVGSLDYKRDWSYAQDIVDAMYLINKNPKSGVYVIGSGSSYSIERIIDRVFNVLNLDYKNYIKVNQSYSEMEILLKFFKSSKVKK